VVSSGDFGASAEAKLWAEPAGSPETAVLLAEDRRQVLRLDADDLVGS
jgi:hypothetical protein